MSACTYNLSKEDIIGIYICKDCEGYEDETGLYPNFQDTLKIHKNGMFDSLYYGKQKYKLIKSKDNWLYISFKNKEKRGLKIPFRKVGKRVYIDLFDGRLLYEKI